MNGLFLLFMLKSTSRAQHHFTSIAGKITKLKIKGTRNTSTASNSTQSINAAWAFSTVFGLPVKHFATIESHTSFAYLKNVWSE